MTTETPLPTAVTHSALAMKALRLLAIVTCIVSVTYISIAPQISNDFWLQAKVGEIIAQTGEIPRTLLFPFTEIRDARFNAHEWLPSVIFYWLIQVFGEDRLPLLLGFSGLLLFALFASLAYRRGARSFPFALIFGLLAVVVENYRHFLRPELLSLLLLGAYLHLLDTCRHKSKPQAWLGALVVVVIWANTHGSFILAPIIAAIFAFGLWVDQHQWAGLGRHIERSSGSVRDFALFSIVALLATLLNPFGLEMLDFVFHFSVESSNFSTPKNVLVYEWLPTFDMRTLDQRGPWIGLGAAVFSILALCLRWRHLSAIDALLFLMFLVLALKVNRFLVYIGIAAAYVLPPLVPAGWRQAKHLAKIYAIAIALAGSALGLALAFGNAFYARPYLAWGVNQSFTTFMVQKLADPELQGNVITSYGYGAELVYRAYPRLRPSIDSRIDSYGAAYNELNVRLFLEDPLLKEFSHDYNVRYMLLNLPDFAKVEKLASWKEGLWSIRAMDTRAVLLERASSPAARP